MTGDYMEERTNNGVHQIQLTDRQQGKITGVTDVISFDPEEVLLSTQMGTLSIKGEQLHVSRLHVEQQEIELDGKVDSLIYTREKPSGLQSGQTFIKRIFR